MKELEGTHLSVFGVGKSIELGVRRGLADDGTLYTFGSVVRTL